MSSRTTTCAIITALLLAAGCGAGPTELAPAGKADRVLGPEREAYAEVAGVRFYVDGDAWPGRDQIARRMTPVRVRIENGAPVPILVRHGHFALTDEGVRRFLTVPAYRAPDAMPQPIVSDRRIMASGFLAVPEDDAFYTAPESAAGIVLQDAHLPVEEMRRYGIPEGLLRPGGFVEGFLFFEHVPEDAGRVLFRADVTRLDGTRVGTALVPLVATE